MIVASGTLTPTSITVVATRILVVAARKILHRRVLVAALHLAVDETDLRAEKLAQIVGAVLRGGEVAVLAALDQRADPIDPRPGADGPRQTGDHFVDALDIDRARVDLLAPRRLFPQRGQFHVAEIGQGERARDRRRGHRQHVYGFALFAEREPLMHPEAVLLVDHGEAQPREGDVVLHQSVGADHDVQRAAREPFQRRAALGRLVAPRHQRDGQARGLGERPDGGEMLARENLRRRHQGGLSSGLDHMGHRQQGDDGLAGADVALQQPQHALVAFEIGGNLRDGFGLVAGEGEGQRGENFSRAEPSPCCARPCKTCAFARTSRRLSWCDSNSS